MIRIRHVLIALTISVTLFCFYLSSVWFMTLPAMIYGGNRVAFDKVDPSERDLILQAAAVTAIRVALPLVVTTLLWVVAFLFYRRLTGSDSLDTKGERKSGDGLGK